MDVGNIAVYTLGSAAIGFPLFYLLKWLIPARRYALAGIAVLAVDAVALTIAPPIEPAGFVYIALAAVGAGLLLEKRSAEG